MKFNLIKIYKMKNYMIALIIYFIIMGLGYLVFKYGLAVYSKIKK